MRFLIVFLIIIFFAPQLAFSQTVSPSNVEESAEDKIDQIKDKVTSQVEKLDLVERRGMVGVVESINENQIRINDLNDKIRIINVDELTKYSSSEDNSFDLSSIEIDTKISVLGIYNKDSEKLLARFVNEISIPIFLTGVISEIDEEEFTILLTTEDEITHTIDIENITKTFEFPEEDLLQSGFSDFKVLQNAIVIGFPDVNRENRISATRVVVFPNIPTNPRINVKTPTPTEEISTSPTGSTSNEN